MCIFASFLVHLLPIFTYYYPAFCLGCALLPSLVAQKRNGWLVGSVNWDKPSAIFGMSAAIAFALPTFEPYASTQELRRRIKLSALLSIQSRGPSQTLQIDTINTLHSLLTVKCSCSWWDIVLFYRFNFLSTTI
jgi:hypothetical protein